MTEAKKRTPPIPLIVLATLALGYAGFKLYKEHKPHEWSGTVEVNTIDVGSRAGGRVKQVLSREGDRVEANQVLVVLESGDLEAQQMMAQGQLDQAQALLERTERGARPEEIEQANARAKVASASLNQYRSGARTEEIGAAKARLSAQEVAVEKAKTDVERARKLFQMQAISKAEADSAETAFRGASAQRDALREALLQLENGARKEEIQQAEGRAMEALASARLVAGGSRVEDIKAARGQLLAAQGKLDAIRVAIGELSIRAPKSARVESLDLRPGDLLAPNTTAARLAEDDQMFVRIFVPETEIGLAKIGTEVPVRVDTFSRTFKGKIDHVNTTGEYTPRNLQTFDERANQVFRAKIQLIEGASELRGGMAAFILAPR